MREKFSRFMEGRYGSDNLTRFLSVVAMILVIVSLFWGGFLLDIIAIGLIVYTYFRMFSRNLYKRSDENERFMESTEKIRRFFRVQKQRFAQRREYRFFRCPGCGQTVRVPKGKGHVLITCPKCRRQFEKTA